MESHLLHTSPSVTETRLEARQLARGIAHVTLRCGLEAHEPLLTRYHFLAESFPDSDAAPAIRWENGALRFAARHADVSVTLSGPSDAPYAGNGFRLRVSLSPQDRLFGLGDTDRLCMAGSGREHDPARVHEELKSPGSMRLMRRGQIVTLWQENIVCYGPIPFIMSSEGWGILVNCTYRTRFDLGATDDVQMIIDAKGGALDFYVFQGHTLADVLERYTALTGRPALLPRKAYGLTFITNRESGAREVLEEGRMFRQLNIPCDTIGLEPSWQKNGPDFSNQKQWNPDLFYMPTWKPDNYFGMWFFTYNMKRMGYALSLWLGTQYDLFYAEEQNRREDEHLQYEGASIVDANFAGSRSLDPITDPEKPFFAHLEKFVDNGAESFKLDGSCQIVAYPDRLWGSRYRDDEIHNLYPLVYARQMSAGYTAHTGKRAFINTVGVYCGTQRYAATWAGDTGCEWPSLTAILNLGLSGHANATCDLYPTSAAWIHACFLLPWVQQLTWRNWLYPWLLGDEIEETYRRYAQLRSRLFPYLYAAAHTAAETGMPIARALPLVYPDTDRYDGLLTEYMLGDALLVCSYDLHVTLPEGEWIDFWTEKRYHGPATFEYTPDRYVGGGLFVKAGSILVTQDWMPYLDAYIPDTLHLDLYPGADAEATLYEDDGATNAYLDGAIARTRISMEMQGERSMSLTVCPRQGTFENMPPACGFAVTLHVACERMNATHNGTPLSIRQEEGLWRFDLPRETRAAGELRIRIAWS